MKRIKPTVARILLFACVGGIGLGFAGQAVAPLVYKNGVYMSRARATALAGGYIKRFNAAGPTIRATLGTCYRVTRNMFDCQARSTFVAGPSRGGHCTMLISMFNDQADARGRYAYHVTGSTLRCSATSRRAPLPANSSYFDVGAGHWVADNTGDGRIIQLEDGSLWQISPVDQSSTGIWLTTDDVVVRTGGTYPYSYRLIDTSDGSSADARYLGSS